MEIEPGGIGKMEIPLGKEIAFVHNKPVTYRVTTSGGSVIEVELPGGVEFKVTSAGDIQSIVVNIDESPTGPIEIV